MSGIEFDSSEVNRLAIDLAGAKVRIQRKAPSVFLKGAIETKRRIQRDASGHDHLPQLASHVGHDRLGFLEHEIGFNKVGQGSLANIAVYGSVNNDPVMDSPLDHLRREMVEIQRHLGDEGEEAVFGSSS